MTRVQKIIRPPEAPSIDTLMAKYAVVAGRQSKPKQAKTLAPKVDRYANVDWRYGNLHIARQLEVCRFRVFRVRKNRKISSPCFFMNEHKGKCQKIMAEGIEFRSIGQAAKILEMTRRRIEVRLNGNYDGYRRF